MAVEDWAGGAFATKGAGGGGGGGSGDVTGPASSTDNAVAVWDGTGGDTLRDSTVFVTATGFGLDSATTAISYVDRGATTNLASQVWRTAGADQWSAGLRNDSTNTWYIRDESTGINVLFMGQGAIPAVSAGGAWTFGNSISLGSQGINMTGSIGSTGSRVLKGWFTDIAVTNGIPGGGLATTEVTGTSQSAAVNTIYITNNAGLVTVTLPTTAALGSILRIVGKGAGGWRVAQNASESIILGNQTTTVGVGGSLASTQQSDCIELVCTTADTTWTAMPPQGNITVV